MTDLDQATPISRRRALALGGGAAGGLLSAAAISPRLAAATVPQANCACTSPEGLLPVIQLPAQRMQDALQAEGSVSNGVLQVSVDRDDIQGVTLHGVPIRPSFQIDGNLTFQPVGRRAFFNGDIPVKRDEVDPVIDAILHNGLVFQAEHQHFYDFDPPVWFIHFRRRGAPIGLAKRVHRVLRATSTPLPQQPPSNPKTPLDRRRLRRILHGDSAEVGADGVVTVSVPRKDQIRIAGVRVESEANISTTVAFQPLDGSGSSAAVAPDFAMTAGEINRVVRSMRATGWDIGCLYNQESAEHPQLYFSHQFKTGDPYELAHEVRRGLNRMNSK